MSHSSKRMIVSMGAGLLTAAAYIIYMCRDASPAPEDTRGWAIAMLVFIGIGVAAVIAAQILLHVALAVGISVREKDKKLAKRELNSITREDERDRSAERKSSVVGYSVAGIGFCAMLAALAAGASFFIALQILFGSFALGSMIEGICGIVWLEAGSRHG